MIKHKHFCSQTTLLCVAMNGALYLVPHCEVTIIRGIIVSRNSGGLATQQCEFTILKTLKSHADGNYQSIKSFWPGATALVFPGFKREIKRFVARIWVTWEIMTVFHGAYIRIYDSNGTSAFMLVINPYSKLDAIMSWVHSLWYLTITKAFLCFFVILFPR